MKVGSFPTLLLSLMRNQVTPIILIIIICRDDTRYKEQIGAQSVPSLLNSYQSDPDGPYVQHCHTRSRLLLLPNIYGI